MEDHILRAKAADNNIRAFAISGKDMVKRARDLHDLSPVATAALGRLLLGGAMMGIMMKGKDDILTVTMRGDGPLGSLVVTAGTNGDVKGYVDDPHVDIPLNYADKLDVGAAIGYGEMIVVKDMGLKEPYVSRLPLGTSEVAEDLTYYFYKSEQTPTSVALGVSLEADGNIKSAGGFIIQLMPGADSELADAIEKKLEEVKPVTKMLEEGYNTLDILEEVLGEFDVEVTDELPVRYYCHCSKERFMNALATLPKDEIKRLAEEDETIKTKCHFCNAEYEFSADELKTFL